MSNITRGEHWERSNLYLFGICCLLRAWLFSIWPLISPERAPKIDNAFCITRLIVMLITHTSKEAQRKNVLSKCLEHSFSLKQN